MKKIIQLFLTTLFLLPVVSWGQTTYTSTATGNWSTQTWSPAGTPGTSDNVIIADGHTVTIDKDVSVASITVGQGLSGTLTFDGTAVRAVTVSGDVTVGAGGSFITQSSGSFINTMSIAGNLSNSGTFNMWGNSTRRVNITLSKSGEITIGGSASSAIFASLTLNLGSISNTCTLSIDVTINGNPTITTGKWIQNSNTTTTLSNTTVSANGELSIGGGTYIQSSNSSLTINGKLTVTSGTLNIGTAVGNTLTISGAGSNASISGGTINISGRWVQASSSSATISGGTINVSTVGQTSSNSDATFQVPGSNPFSMSSGIVKIFNANSGTAGDLKITNSNASISGGTFIIGNSSSTTGNIQINSSVSLSNLTIDAGTTTPALATNLTLSGILTLTSGNITISSYKLTLGSSASSTGNLERTSGIVIGNFERWFATGTNSNFIFPVGTASDYRPVTISTANVTTGGKILVAHTDGSDGTDLLSTLNDGGYTIDRRSNMYWTLTGTTIAGGTYDLSLDGSGQSGISEPASLRIIHSSDGSTFDLQGTHSNGSGTVANRTGISVGTFNRFYIGSQKAVNPLPVELSSFTSNVIGNKVELNWKTATEVNNYGFEVERSEKLEARGEKWTKIGFVEGNGNSNSPKSYSFTDEPTGGKEFNYRLKQIDFDGEYEYSEVITAALENVSTFVLEQNYPNPFNPTTKISYTIPERVNVKLKIYDMIAQQVAELVNTTQEAGHYQITFDGSDLPSGVYFYKLEAGKFVEVKKFMLIK